MKTKLENLKGLKLKEETTKIANFLTKCLEKFLNFVQNYNKLNVNENLLNQLHGKLWDKIMFATNEDKYLEDVTYFFDFIDGELAALQSSEEKHNDDFEEKYINFVELLKLVDYVNEYGIDNLRNAKTEIEDKSKYGLV